MDLVRRGKGSERLAESLGRDDGGVVVLVEGALVHAEHGDAVPDGLQNAVGAKVGEEQPRLWPRMVASYQNVY